MMLKSPFPWFGGKSRVAPVAWEAFGDVVNYVEPFFGSGATLLGRDDYDQTRHTETINDLDCFVANFWRAIQQDSETVAYWADSPVNEADLLARHQWLLDQHKWRERMKTDPDFFDAKIAGWWVWGQCCWIGSGWCQQLSNQIPHLGNAGRGVHRRLPHLGDAGKGVHRIKSYLGNIDRQASDLYEYFEALAARLRRVRVCCGDWSRVLGSSVTEKIGVTGVFLDPPYSHDLRQRSLYSEEMACADDVAQWAIANQSNPKLRIALCGYAGEHNLPGWHCYEWKAPGGYSTRNSGNKNCEKERVWFSPHCLPVEKPKQLSLVI